MRMPRLLLFVCTTCLLVPLAVMSAELRPHMDRAKLPFGCGTCHVGFNFGNSGSSFQCIWCHGPASNKPDRYVGAYVTLPDIASEYKKPYRHPTFDVRGIHSSTEILPERDPNMPRHADCVDCHNPHYLSPQNKFAGIKGKQVGNLIADVTLEYELCYRCHAESANLPGNFKNKRAEFAQTNLSFHPVEAEGRNSMVISLIKPYREKKQNPGDISMISCHDCHGSDDPKSPQGPHGSRNEHILVDNYSTKDNEIEGPLTYALCYRCHSRTSILANESFKYHAKHIVGTGGAVPDGTSCHTCHNSHGSAENRYLIKFNPTVVTANARGVLKFVEKGIYARSGECYLSCHGVDHDPKTY